MTKYEKTERQKYKRQKTNRQKYIKERQKLIKMSR